MACANFATAEDTPSRTSRQRSSSGASPTDQQTCRRLQPRPFPNCAGSTYPRHSTSVLIERSRRAPAKGWGQLTGWEPAVGIPATIFADNIYEDAHRAQRDQSLKKEGDEGFIGYFQEIIPAGAAASNPFQPFKTILSHLATGSPSSLEPVLVHCSLGKYRTGVVCAMILSICDVPDDIVAQGYALSVVGLAAKVTEIISTIRPERSWHVQRGGVVLWR
ncbi:hypothetical protein B0T14DRAFT_83124 [Immersiella caudata]|uniref:Tyrosine specific protein phosphatases domain-containing protein n=1 Tax=Immersiella caudata TaxID=314043 RepID=A0AA39XGZ2_9PEZI|nr:hypothetical protein B0T14DRAFT_83124 [Immersiella caudata]